MKRFVTILLALAVVCAPGAGTTQADLNTAAGLLSNRQGLRWARSAVVPFHTPALPEKPIPGFVRMSFGRGHAELPDFDSYQDIETKKIRFFSWLLPLVQEENQRLLDLRQRLDYVHEHKRWHRRLDAEDAAWLADVAREFGLEDMDPADDTFWTVLFRRVDALPDDLVLVQAANESAWGTSRFAREGNNLFGQWCFREGCGLVPLQRPDGETYEVAKFDSVDASVASYMHNLNTGRTYKELREIRAAARAESRAPAATDLAAGLTRYSERGQAYIDELRAMIRHNAEAIDRARERLDESS